MKGKPSEIVTALRGISKDGLEEGKAFGETL